eukprot:XP_017167913.1 PREDICTED: uncharacterized protein Gm22496 [Mus musculus]
MWISRVHIGLQTLYANKHLILQWNLGYFCIEDHSLISLSFLVFCSHLTCHLGRQRTADNQGRHSSKFQERVPLLLWKAFHPCIPLQFLVTIPNSEAVLERKERYSSKFQTRVPLLPWKNFLACIPLQLHVTIPNSEEVWERKSYDMPPWKAENHRYQRLSPLSSCQEAWQCPGAEERAKNSPS